MDTKMVSPPIHAVTAVSSDGKEASLHSGVVKHPL